MFLFFSIVMKLNSAFLFWGIWEREIEDGAVDRVLRVGAEEWDCDDVCIIGDDNDGVVMVMIMMRMIIMVLKEKRVHKNKEGEL